MNSVARQPSIKLVTIRANLRSATIFATAFQAAKAHPGEGSEVARLMLQFFSKLLVRHFAL